MELFPISLKLGGRKCVVVGAGVVGEAKAQGLLAAGADLVVVAPSATNWIARCAAEQQLTWHQRPFAASDLDGAFLVVAAAGSGECNAQVFRAASERRVLCNVVDDPDCCDFFYPAVVRRGALQIAISTGGHSPALAHRLRVELEEQFGPEYAEWVEEVGRTRREILQRDLPPEQCRQLIEKIGSRESYEEFVRRRLQAAREDTGIRPGGEAD
ncbi:MAG TPA: bifunctional precorrin-2 dehydrogenase/sirohydrochlorin ferrochelatase [Candidatus Binatia bacterium]|nr:bifunctional precorrin-2 dehydrogenase/sirohydrochlorin ferrochelatase [Candidatus Binatia bacterium]